MAAGVDGFAHSVRDQDVEQALLSEMKRRGVGEIPTLTQEWSNHLYESTPAIFSDPFLLRHLDAWRNQIEGLKDPGMQEKIRGNQQAQRSKPGLKQAMRNLKLMSDAGVLIAMGTDSGGRREAGRWQGYIEHKEMELMVESGMTPTQTLVAATSGAARLMALDKNVGSLQAGKYADFIVWNADPLADIRNLRQIDSVWVGGRRLNRDAGVTQSPAR